MTSQIKHYIAKCEVCATYQKEQPKEPLICHKIPSRPWEIVGSDIFHFQGKDYLFTVDYYLNYFEVDSLKEKATAKVIQVLKRHFARHGIPNQLVSDNGPPSTPSSSSILQKVMIWNMSLVLPTTRRVTAK